MALTFACAATACSTPVGEVQGQADVGAPPTMTAGQASDVAEALGDVPSPPAPSPTTPSASPSQTPTAAPSTPSSPAATGASPLPTEVDPAEAARQIGLDGLIDLLDQDPERAGGRGEDLLDELRRVADRPRDRGRIDRALDRLERWSGELDGDVARAAEVVLTDLRGAADQGGDDDDDDDDD